MGKIAFVFSGQGAQYAGMGKSLYESSDVVKKLYLSAEEIRPGTIKQSFEGREDELKDTKNTQPCLYLVDLAAALSLNENGIYADGVAGFSLGEIAALAYAGAYSYTDGFNIVTQRGEAMSKAATKHNTAMCAVLKMDSDSVEKICSEYDNLYAVNFNCPGQVVVSGAKESIDSFSLKVKELGGRCIPLAVSAAFHSPYMNDAADEFFDKLKEFNISFPKIPVYSNLNAMEYDKDVKGALRLQMKSPVRWQETIENMISDGYTDFIEVGAGNTLSGLIKKISKDVGVYSVEDADSLSITVKAVKENA